MRTVTISEQDQKVLALLKQATYEDIIVQTPDGGEFMLTEIDDFQQEIERTRRNKPLMALLDRRGRQTKTIALDKAKQMLGLSD